MSTISTTHNITKYTPGETKPFAEQRLSKHSWKTDKITNVKPESKCASIPKLSHTVLENEGIKGHLIAYLETVQDSMIKGMIVEGKTTISDNEIEIGAIVEFLDAGNESGRLTKEDAGKWFAEKIEDNIALALAEKLGVSETPSEAESERIFAIVEEFKNKITSLVAGKTSYNAQIAASLEKALEFCEDKEDPIYVRFSARLEKMKAVPEMNLLDAL